MGTKAEESEEHPRPTVTLKGLIPKPISRCVLPPLPRREPRPARDQTGHLSADILAPGPGQTLVLADLEHQTAELFDHVQRHTPFDLLVPMKNQRSLQKQLRAIPAEQFTRR